MYAKLVVDGQELRAYMQHAHEHAQTYFINEVIHFFYMICTAPHKECESLTKNRFIAKVTSVKTRNESKNLRRDDMR